MKPVMKWAGGKTQLLGHITSLLPKRFNHYFEPFLGGGALFLELSPGVSTVNDINPELVNVYLQIKASPEAVMAALENIDANHEDAVDAKQSYYAIRNLFNENMGTATPQQAARFIFINKHCFNGLYRVNKKGFFNVPFNNKPQGKSFVPEDIHALSERLQTVTILGGDFERAIATAREGDFVFFDPPYAPLCPMSFTDYTKEGFGYDDNVRLANLYKELSQRGVFCMLTNHNTAFIRDLYSEFSCNVVSVARNINAKASGRKGEEVIITSYVV